MLTTNRLVRSSIVVLALACASAASVAATTAQRTLANGMNVIVKEDHRSPFAEVPKLDVLR